MINNLETIFNTKPAYSLFDPRVGAVQTLLHLLGCPSCAGGRNFRNVNPVDQLQGRLSPQFTGSNYSNK